MTQDIIQHFCEKNNIIIENGALSDFETLTSFLLEFNSHTNLTAVRDEEGVAIKHHADSVFGLTTGLFEKNASVIDVGCGAGFPGLPLNILRRDLSVSFLDSTEKKLRFTKEACEKLGLSGTFLPVRAEDAACDVKYREKFDIAVSRAMANLPVLCELCLPFVRVGGYFIAYKTERASFENDPESELSRSKDAVQKLGGKFERSVIYDLAALCGLPENPDMRHSLIIIRKIKPTQPAYPRRYAQILKKPL